MRWSLRGLHWSYCAFVAWASLQTFLDALPGHDLHALLLSSVELIAIAAFLVDRFATPSCGVLCAVFAVAAVITTLKGQAPLEFPYFAATAIVILIARRQVNERTAPRHADLIEKL